MGELQIKLLKKMSTGTYDKKGLALISGVDSPRRVIDRLVARGYLSEIYYWTAMDVDPQIRKLVLYKRTEKGDKKANSYGQLLEPIGMCELCGEKEPCKKCGGE